MTKPSPLLEAVRDATEPTSTSLDRVRSRIRTTLAEEPPPAVALGALPDPSAGAFARVRARILRTLEHDRQRGSRLTGFGLIAGTAALTALVFLLTRADLPGRPGSEQPGQQASAGQLTPPPPPSETPREAPTPSAVASTAPGSEEPRGRAPIEPRGGGPDEPRGRALARIDGLQTFGQTDAAEVERVLAGLRPKLDRCLEGAAGTVRVSVAVDVEGRPSGAAVEGDAAPEVVACARELVMAARFGQGAGLRAGTREEVTGGVIRFQIQRGKP